MAGWMCLAKLAAKTYQMDPSGMAPNFRSAAACAHAWGSCVEMGKAAIAARLRRLLIIVVSFRAV